MNFEPRMLPIGGKLPAGMWRTRDIASVLGRWYWKRRRAEYPAFVGAPEKGIKINKGPARYKRLGPETYLLFLRIQLWLGIDGQANADCSAASSFLSSEGTNKNKNPLPLPQHSIYAHSRPTALMERNSWVDDPDMIVPYTWNLASRQSPATLPGRQLAGGAWAPLTSEISLKDLFGAREFVAVREWLAWCVCLGVCCFCSLWQRLCQQPRMRVNWAPANIFRRKHRNRSKDWLRELFYALDGDVCSLPRITYAVAIPIFHREWCSFF